MNSDPSAANMWAESVIKSPEDDNQQALAMLQKSDLETTCVLDDLIHLLVRKGVIVITNPPSVAQVKLMDHTNAHQELGGLKQPLDNDGRIF